MGSDSPDDVTVFTYMDEHEAALADDIYAAIQAYTVDSDRGRQAQEYRAGVSDLGFCSTRLLRMLRQEDEDPMDMLPAFLGTAIGDHVEKAIKAKHPDAIIQPTVEALLVGERSTYTVPGHPDIVLPSEGIVLDGKTDYGLDTVRRTGPDQQQQFQRHCYGLGAHRAGLFGDLPLEEVRVANCWVDRAGVDRAVHVNMESFDMRQVEMAAMWLDDVVYAYVHDGEARKEPPREMCAVTCGFYGVCRAPDVYVEGLITDTDALAAVDMDREGKALMDQGKHLRDQAKAHLRGIEGSTGEYVVRWVPIAAAEFTTRRKAYERLQITPIK